MRAHHDFRIGAALCCLQVELKVTAVRCIHRAAALPLELADASRSEAQIAAAQVGLAAVSLQCSVCAFCVAASEPCAAERVQQIATCRQLLAHGVSDTQLWHLDRSRRDLQLASASLALASAHSSRLMVPHCHLLFKIRAALHRLHDILSFATMSARAGSWREDGGGAPRNTRLNSRAFNISILMLLTHG